MRRQRTAPVRVLVVVAVVLAGCGSGSTSTSRSTTTAASSVTGKPSARTYPLTFPTSDYTTVTETIEGTKGNVKVKYRLYRDIVYVANPIDTTYESLDVSAPVEIAGRKVDSSSAPILLAINVGGYTSTAVPSGTGAGGAPSGGAPSGSGAPPSGSGPSGGPPGSSTKGRSSVPTGAGETASNSQLALAAGYVVVTPGVRGRDNVTSSGRYFGKAPAAIVDLKAAVRYLHHNQGRVPGDTKLIVSTGTSAGGALSTLLAASGGSQLYDSYLRPLGAAEASDAIFAAAAYSPITDLNHADTAYEWQFGTLPYDGKLVDQTLSSELREAFVGYEASLHLRGQGGFGTITEANLGDYVVKGYLEPAAEQYVDALSSGARSSYLAKNTWITWSGGRATFTWSAFLAHLGSRLKSVPAFDSLTLEAAENGEFGDETTNARHFTDFSLRHATGNPSAQIAGTLAAVVNLMNPMYFLERENSQRARHWFLRAGAIEGDTSLAIVSNMAALLQEIGGDSVNSGIYWEAGHGANEDPAAFVAWMNGITGYRGSSG